MRSIRGAGRTAWAFVLALGLVASAGTTAPAQEEGSAITQYGFRGGISLDPDQFVIGAFMGFREFSPGFSMRPSADIGLGDDVFVLMINGDANYHFRQADFAAVPYVGAGIALAYYNFDSAAAKDSATEIGVNLFGGLEWELGGYRSAFAELRIGLGDIPDLKIMGGFAFL
jgi:hypothetical protein